MFSGYCIGFSSFILVKNESSKLFFVEIHAVITRFFLKFQVLTKDCHTIDKWLDYVYVDTAIKCARI